MINQYICWRPMLDPGQSEIRLDPKLDANIYIQKKKEKDEKNL